MELVLTEKYDAIYNRIRYLINQKSGITYTVSLNYARIKFDSFDYLPLEFDSFDYLPLDYLPHLIICLL